MLRLETQEPKGCVNQGLQLAAQQDGWKSLAREKRVIIPADLTTHSEGDHTAAGWLAAYLPYHAQGITPYSRLSALSTLLAEEF